MQRRVYDIEQTARKNTERPIFALEQAEEKSGPLTRPDRGEDATSYAVVGHDLQ